MLKAELIVQFHNAQVLTAYLASQVYAADSLTHMKLHTFAVRIVLPVGAWPFANL